jgi:hypothetical protein
MLGGAYLAFIKIQKLVQRDDGSIKIGSAYIVDSVYTKDDKYHSKHVVREKLGRVLSISSDHKCGIFLSPTR